MLGMKRGQPGRSVAPASPRFKDPPASAVLAVLDRNFFIPRVSVK